MPAQRFPRQTGLSSIKPVRYRRFPVPDVSTGGGPPGPGGFTDDFSLNILVADSNAVPTDNATFALALDLTDANADLTETVSLGFSGSDFSDSNAVPSETNNFTMRVWLSGSTGAGVTNPANANGQNDGAVATISTAIAGSSTETLTSALGANVPSGVVVTSAIYRGWFQSVNTLITSSGELIMQSLSALFGDVTMFSNSGLSTTINHLSGDFTFDLVAGGVDTLAKLQSCQILHRASDAVAGVTPHVLTVDAGCIELAGAFT